MSVRRVLQHISIVELKASTPSTATSRGSYQNRGHEKNTHPVYNNEDNTDFVYFYVRTQQWSWSLLIVTVQVNVCTNAAGV